MFNQVKPNSPQNTHNLWLRALSSETGWQSSQVTCLHFKFRLHDQEREHVQGVGEPRSARTPPQLRPSDTPPQLRSEAQTQAFRGLDGSVNVHSLNCYDFWTLSQRQWGAIDDSKQEEWHEPYFYSPLGYRNLQVDKVLPKTFPRGLSGRRGISCLPFIHPTIFCMFLSPYHGPGTLLRAKELYVYSCISQSWY